MIPLKNQRARSWGVLVEARDLKYIGKEKSPIGAGVIKSAEAGWGGSSLG